MKRLKRIKWFQLTTVFLSIIPAPLSLLIPAIPSTKSGKCHIRSLFLSDDIRLFYCVIVIHGDKMMLLHPNCSTLPLCRAWKKHYKIGNIVKVNMNMNMFKLMLMPIHMLHMHIYRIVTNIKTTSYHFHVSHKMSAKKKRLLVLQNLILFCICGLSEVFTGLVDIWGKGGKGGEAERRKCWRTNEMRRIDIKALWMK